MIKRDVVNLVLATDLSQRLRSALEFGATAGLVILLTALAVSRFETYVLHAQVSEAMMVTSTIRPDIVVHRAQHGEWPASADDLQHSELEVAPRRSGGKFIDRVELGSDGALSVVFDAEDSHARLANRRLTFRPQTRSDEPGAPVVWTCGLYKPAPGLTLSGDNLTDIAAGDLPSLCRGN